MTQEELQKKHNNLVNKVNEMLDCQQAYFKSNKDFQLLKKSKVLESEVRLLCNPKPAAQQSFFNDDFLGR